MRKHANDPTHVPDAITNGGWEDMHWHRWAGRTDLSDVWKMTVIDVSGCDVHTVATDIAAWTRSAIAGEAPVFRRGWHHV